MKQQRQSLSVALPCYNERENIVALLTRLTPILEALTEGAYEIIFVDDGSRDGSPDIVRSLHEQNSRIKLVQFSRNFGHQAALSAGMAEATGDAVILMDADLQDPPELIAAFVEQWRKGYEIVYAVRSSRPEGAIKRGAYSLFYRSMHLLADIDVPLDAGDFCLMDRMVVDAVLAMPERHRFLRGLRAWVGFNHVGVAYDREARHSGDSKYTFRRLVRLALSGYVGFSTAPLRLATLLGLLTTSLGFLLACWVVAAKLTGAIAPRGWASTMAVYLFLGGTQLLMLGIVSEYIGRVYDEVRQRPSYVVRGRLGLQTRTGIGGDGCRGEG